MKDEIKSYRYISRTVQTVNGPRTYVTIAPEDGLTVEDVLEGKQ